MLIAAISPLVTLPVAIAALLIGIVLIIGGPLLLKRLTSSSPSSSPSLWVRWSQLLVVDLIACIFLYSAVYSFGWIPLMISTVLKLASIAVAAFIISGISGFLFFQRT